MNTQIHPAPPRPAPRPTPRGEQRRAQSRTGQDPRKNPRSYEFLGTDFEPLTLAQTLERTSEITLESTFRYIVTPNVDHIVRLRKEPDVFKPLYKASWLSVCDSRILELLANLSGIPLKAVPGSDLTAQLFDHVIEKDTPITVIGGDSAVIKAVRERYGLEALKVHVPPMGMRSKPEAIAAAAKFIADNPARYTFICVGSPQQEMVAKAALERGDCAGLGLCVGASLDFLAGKQVRAPKWLQAIRMEWLFRLLKEPKRMYKRYLIEGPKIFVIYLGWVFKNMRG
ncbi:MAG: WecB/TagA/CpsF family glycosyltransferase [Robiginitomaculum sp.]